MNYQIEIQFKDTDYSVELRASNKEEAKRDALILAKRCGFTQTVKKVTVKKL
jgi:hypothetical protein